MKRFLICTVTSSLLITIFGCAPKKVPDEKKENVVVAQDVSKPEKAPEPKEEVTAPSKPEPKKEVPLPSEPEPQEVSLPPNPKLSIEAGRIVWSDKEKIAEEKKSQLSKEFIERRIYQADLEKLFPQHLELNLSKNKIVTSSELKTISAIVIKNPYYVPFKVKIPSANINDIKYSLRILLSTLNSATEGKVNDVYGELSGIPLKITDPVISIMETGKKIDTQKEDDGSILWTMPARETGKDASAVLVEFLTRFEEGTSKEGNVSGQANQPNMVLPKGRDAAHGHLQVSIHHIFFLQYVPDVKIKNGSSEWVTDNNRIDGKIDVVGVLKLEDKKIDAKNNKVVGVPQGSKK